MVLDKPANESKRKAGLHPYLEELMTLDIQELWDLASSLDKYLECYMLAGVQMNIGVANQGL
ncbi:hypothetical protein DQK91_22460 [Oceanidesulfovibrio marinus]|uniref:Uncharacterized protein n=1 Tax=Oceanidesulfovibrio marinus TaxID=370038 RepID=A0A6P1ZDU1_9BACT|nr:hypothetical protein DQK91_22460 [Oceanidesulfovibrio marinus]